MAMHSPPHPGRVVRQECIEPLGLTVAQAARALGVTRQTVDRLVNQRCGVSPEMALRLEAAFGGDASTWLAMQSAYDLAQVRRRAAEITAGLRRLAPALQPGE
jgi:addiction module HigA family antidote